MGKPERRGLIGTNKPRWEKTKIISKKLVEKVWTASVSFTLVWGDVNTVMNFGVSCDIGHFLTVWQTAYYFLRKGFFQQSYIYFYFV